MNQSRYSIPAIFGLVFAPFALAYFFSYLVRNVDATIFKDLEAAFDLTKGELGIMSAAYFFSFTLAQIPLGYALDAYGARRVQSALYCLAAVGCMLAATATGFVSMSLARFLIGLGVAGGLMCALQAISQWFPPERLPLINNIMLAVGGLGSMAATWPIQQINLMVEWRLIFWGLVGVALLVPALLLAITPEPDKPKAKANRSLGTMLDIIRHPAFYVLVPAMTFGMGAGMSMQSLWVGPWVTDRLGLDDEAKSLVLLAINATFVITALGLGWMAPRMKAWGWSIPALMLSTLICGAAAYALLAVLPPVFGVWLFAVVIICQNGTFLIYAYLTQQVGPQVAGVSNALINCLVFGFVWMLMSLTGYIIDGVKAMGGSLDQGYTAAFVFLAIGCTSGCLWTLSGWHKLER